MWPLIRVSSRLPIEIPELKHYLMRSHPSTDFQDIHVMIFVGFAFLMTFLKRYGYSATGFNLVLGAFVIQAAIIARGLFDLQNGYIA